MKLIRFIADNPNIHKDTPAPKPAKNYIPKWFKNANSFKDNKRNFIPSETSGTYKKCPPILDAFTNGYIQELWCDVFVQKTDAGLELTWGVDLPPLENRSSEQMSGFPVPKGFSPQPLVWLNPWGWKTPKGYSILLTHPLNRDDLPFRTVSALVDTDKFNLSGKVAFWIDESFEGVIPAGTPIFQLTLIKRNSWLSKIEKFNNKKNLNRLFKLRKIIFDSYKKQYWSKKEFE
jgi:hypothetical protein